MYHHTVQTKNDKKEQEFELIPVWVRYLKLRFLSHWGTEPVCTLSLLRVHGGGCILILDCEHMQGRIHGVTYLVDFFCRFSVLDRRLAFVHLHTHAYAHYAAAWSAQTRCWRGCQKFLMTHNAS